MGAHSHVWAKFSPRVHFGSRMYADKAFNLVSYHTNWLSQDVLIDSLIVLEVDLLNVKKLLSFLDLLPEVLVTIH